MQLEGYPLDKMAQVVCASDDIRVLGRCCTPNSDGPPMCMVRRAQFITLFLSENDGSIAVDYSPVNRNALLPRSVKIHQLGWLSVENVP